MKNIIKRIVLFRFFVRDFFILSERLEYVNITRTLNRMFVFILLSMFIIGYSVGRIHVKKDCQQLSEYFYLEDSYPMGTTTWKDKVFLNYEHRANIYLSREMFDKTPITPHMLALAARNTYEQTGILVPVELALAQAQIESSMGRAGRSPVNNPWNIGEYDNKTVLYFESTFDGATAYYKHIAKYLQCRSLEELFENFVSCDGYRWASSITYETAVKKLFFFIKNWIDVEVKKEIENGKDKN